MNELTSPTRRVDLHCHSTASQVSKLGVQRALGLPECATPPEEVYELAKRRGMDFVTITDHDTIDGALEIAERHDDAFVSEELTCWFPNEPQSVHVLCLGITVDDHEWLQAHARDLDAVAEYLADQAIACSLAHPFFSVGAPLLPRHRRRLARLFDVWETRNGARAPELNAPAAIYVETHGGSSTGGSDDHAGVDIGRTWTETPAAGHWRAFLEHVRAGRTEVGGEQGSAAKWAHSALALATRALGSGPVEAAPDPAVVIRMVERLVVEGEARHGDESEDLTPRDARSLLCEWVKAMDLDLVGGDLVAHMQADGFLHRELFRHARRRHDRRLVAAVEDAISTTRSLAGHAATDERAPAVATAAHVMAGAAGLFDAFLPVVPYAPATTFLAREKAKLSRPQHESVRVALAADAIGGVHGVTRAIEEVRERGVPGYEVEVIGTDHNVDRRLSAVAEVEIPFYEGLRIGIPGVPAVIDAIADGHYDAVHVSAPGPVGVAVACAARMMGLPVLGSYHTELEAYAAMRTGSEAIGGLMAMAVAAFYERCDRVLSPSSVADAALLRYGIPAARIGRWDRGVDTGCFHPGRRDPALLAAPDGSPRINVLYAGRLTREKGIDLLAEGFLTARERDPRLHLVVAGGGPEEAALRARLGAAATFLGWQSGEELAASFASADLFLFCSQTDTFGQVLLEAQASGLPVVAVAAGASVELIQHRWSGWLASPDAPSVADVLTLLADAPVDREHLAAGGLAAARARNWQASLDRLADGYASVLTPPPAVSELPDAGDRALSGVA